VFKCLKIADAGGKPTCVGTKIKDDSAGTQWELQHKYVGRPKVSVTQQYPDCLQTNSLFTALTGGVSKKIELVDGETV